MEQNRGSYVSSARGFCFQRSRFLPALCCANRLLLHIPAMISPCSCKAHKLTRTHSLTPCSVTRSLTHSHLLAARTLLASTRTNKRTHTHTPARARSRAPTHAHIHAHITTRHKQPLHIHTYPPDPTYLHTYMHACVHA